MTKFAPKITDKQVAAAAKRIAAGKTSMSAAARALDVKPSTLSRRLKRVDAARTAEHERKAQDRAAQKRIRRAGLQQTDVPLPRGAVQRAAQTSGSPARSAPAPTGTSGFVRTPHGKSLTIYGPGKGMRWAGSKASEDLELEMVERGMIRADKIRTVRLY